MIWSKRKKELQNLLVKNLGIQVHCNSYRQRSCFLGKRKSKIPRYWIDWKGEIIWDWPKDEIKVAPLSEVNQKCYSYNGTVIGYLIDEYVSTSPEDLLDKKFKDDVCGFTEILKACDKRIGKRRLPALMQSLENDWAIKIVQEIMKSNLGE